MCGIIRCLAFSRDATLLPLSRRGRPCRHLSEEQQHPAVISGRWAQVSVCSSCSSPGEVSRPCVGQWSSQGHLVGGCPAWSPALYGCTVQKYHWLSIKKYQRDVPSCPLGPHRQGNFSLLLLFTKGLWSTEYVRKHKSPDQPSCVSQERGGWVCYPQSSSALPLPRLSLTCEG